MKKDFKASKQDELSLNKGDYVQILEKNSNGWWLVKSNSKQGMAPAVFLVEFHARNVRESMKESLINWDEIIESNFIDYQAPPRNQVFNHDAEDSCSLISSVQSMNDSFSIQSNKPEIFFAIDDYFDKVGDGVNLKRGKQVLVLSKENSTGWWYVKIDEIEGWAPSGFLSVIFFLLL